MTASGPTNWLACLALCELRAQIKAQMGADAETDVVVLKYSSQVVAGKNYFIKVELVKAAVLQDIMHVRIFVPLGDGTPELMGALKGKSVDEVCPLLPIQKSWPAVALPTHAMPILCAGNRPLRGIQLLSSGGEGVSCV
jgi:hypothetical protein